MAIESVVAEEATWRATHLAERVYEVGKLAAKDQGAVYYTRSVEGTEIEDLARLKGVRRTFISRGEALDLRREHDAQWYVRPKIHDRLSNLWQAGKLHEYSDGRVGRVLTADDDPDSKSPVYTLLVARDGELSMEIDRPAISHENSSIAWHEYNLPRGTSECIRRLKLTAAHCIQPRVAINGDTMVRFFEQNLDEFTELSARSDDF